MHDHSHRMSMHDPHDRQAKRQKGMTRDRYYEDRERERNHRERDPHSHSHPHQQHQHPHPQQQQYQQHQQHILSKDMSSTTTRPNERPFVAIKKNSKQEFKVDFKTNTDFLECAESSALTEQQLVDLLQPITEKGHDYDLFSSAPLVDSVNTLRENIRQAPLEQRSTARAKSNPYESINKSIFMNRAATKIAALDATFALSATQENKPFHFADLCGGPGGFTEYLLWRVYSGGGRAHGYGMTLKTNGADLDWNTDKFRPDIPLHFTPLDGPEASGDIYSTANRDDFGSTVLKETHSIGVDLVVADGGFDFTGNEHHQEPSTHRLLLCEIITMLKCLRAKGTFVCKFFDMNEELTVNMVWLLYQLFDMICITKPLTSRPANAERYLVCKGLRFFQPQQLICALEKIQEQLKEGSVRRFVDTKVIQQDEAFDDYVKMRILKMLLKQTEALSYLEAHLKDALHPLLYDQEAIRRQCMAEWRLPLYE
ncbi:FtsJ-like methyltransferase-domain-containing protein [Spinellus fusiger]|nr:FtsJ-like methyltransferase-domain-containing protein [Spinellus fusiger]